jgi:hypothetical protein
MRPQSHLKATPKPGESSDVSTAPFVPYPASGKTRCSGVLAGGLGHRTALARRSKSYTWGSHPPDTVRAPTVSPPCPLPTSTLPDGWLGRRFSILRIVPMKDGLCFEQTLAVEFSPAPLHRNQQRTRFCYGHLSRFLLLARPMLRNQTKSASLAFVAASGPI